MKEENTTVPHAFIEGRSLLAFSSAAADQLAVAHEVIELLHTLWAWKTMENLGHLLQNEPSNEGDFSQQELAQKDHWASIEWFKRGPFVLDD